MRSSGTVLLYQIETVFLEFNIYMKFTAFSSYSTADILSSLRFSRSPYSHSPREKSLESPYVCRQNVLRKYREYPSVSSRNFYVHFEEKTNRNALFALVLNDVPNTCLFL